MPGCTWLAAKPDSSYRTAGTEPVRSGRATYCGQGSGTGRASACSAGAAQMRTSKARTRRRMRGWIEADRSRSCEHAAGGGASAIEELELLRRRELVPQRLVVGDAERLVGGVPAAPPEDRLVAQAMPVEMHLLQGTHEDLLGLRVLELRHQADEIGEPLPVHPAAAPLALAEL